MTYTPNVLDTGFPPTFLNKYVLAQLAKFGLIADEDVLGTTPMVPAQFPTNIEDLYNDSLEIRQTDNPILIVYDRLMRFRPNSFYRNKREQLIYFIYSTDVDKLLNSIRVISDALDREDAAAQHINAWIAENPIINRSGVAVPSNVFFHNVRVYQADESRDVAELASARTLFVNKIVVEYDYHTTTPTDYPYN